MFFTKAWFRLFWVLLLLTSTVMVFNLFKVESSLLKLLPKYNSKQTNEMVNKATESVNNQLILMAAAEDQSVLIHEFVKALQTIENESYINAINYQVDAEQIQHIYQTLSPHRHNIISPEDQVAFENKLSVDYFLIQAQEKLYGVQQFNASQLSADPLFLWQRLLESLGGLNVMSFDTNEGYFQVHKNNRYHMVAFIELAGSAFSPENQVAVVQGIETMKADLAVQGLDLFSFGAVLYSHQAFQDAKHEISTVGLGSLIGIILLLVLVFRSVIPLLLCVLSISLGLVFSLALVLLIFTQVHAFALVFGATIAGVSIDYCFHYLVVSSFNPNSQSKASEAEVAKKILPALLIGFFSTAMVYLGFMITGYDVLVQVAMFSVFGLLAVLINVLVFFPWFHRSKSFKNSDSLLKVTHVMLNNPIQKAFKSPVLPLSLLLTTVLLAYFLLKPNDDVRALQQLSPALKQEETYIRDILSWPSQDSFVLIVAENLDALMAKEAAVLASLRETEYDVVGISDFIPGLKQQQQHHQILQSLYTNQKVKAYFEQFDLTIDELKAFDALDVNVLNHDAFSRLFQQRWLGDVNGQQTLIIPLPKAVTFPAELSENDHQVTLIQQAEDTSALFAEFRIESTWVLAIAVLILWLSIGFFRYGFLRAAHMMSLPLLAGSLALLMAWTLGFHISLFSILAWLLILGMGLDYVIFLQESEHPHEVMLALMMSSFTTVLAFGLLAFSQVAVLQSFGFMVGTGITWVLLMAPAVLQSKMNTNTINLKNHSHAYKGSG